MSAFVNRASCDGFRFEHHTSIGAPPSLGLEIWNFEFCLRYFLVHPSPRQQRLGMFPRGITLSAKHSRQLRHP